MDLWIYVTTVRWPRFLSPENPKRSGNSASGLMPSKAEQYQISLKPPQDRHRMTFCYNLFQVSQKTFISKTTHAFAWVDFRSQQLWNHVVKAVVFRSQLEEQQTLLLALGCQMLPRNEVVEEVVYDVLPRMTWERRALGCFDETWIGPRTIPKFQTGIMFGRQMALASSRQSRAASSIPDTAVWKFQRHTAIKCNMPSLPDFNVIVAGRSPCHVKTNIW